MPRPRIVEIKGNILASQTLRELDTHVYAAVKALDWLRGYNPKLSYADNAELADANLNSGVADCLRMAAQRKKYLAQRDKLGTSETQMELEV